MLLLKRTAIGEQLYKLLESELNSKVVGNIRKRVALVGDLYKWKPDILEIWEMKKQKIPEAFEILWDGEFVCRFKENERVNVVIARFWSKLLELVKNDTISFRWRDKLKVDELELLRANELKKTKTDKEKKEAKQADKLITKLTTEEKEIAEIAIKEVKKEAKKKKKKKLIL